MTARNKQVALTSSHTPSINPKVPVFLQKLYKIVSDPDTNDVICWSDLGDSFFVLDHERLAKEHLGVWFKHNKFASFVRQLNMYGFHKIPHLQQGVLRSNSEAEHSQFAHPNFRRGEENLLLLIERKKQASNPKEQGIVDFPALPAQPPPQSQSDQSTGQALDIHAVVNGIAAIRRHQANISTELNELKRSNQLLWQESMEARNRHQKQQDTINRIVKFLAGVFGQHAASPAGQEKEHGATSPQPVVRGTRLMIEDRKGEPAPKVGIIEVQDEEAASPVSISISRDQSPYLFASVDTPGSTFAQTPASHPSPGATEISSVAAPTPRVDLTSEALTSTGSPTMQNSIISTQPQYPGSDISHNDDNLPQISPSKSPAFDERWQAAISFLTPADFQSLFASLNSSNTFSTEAGDLNSLQQSLQQNQLPPSSPSSSQTVAPFNFGSLSPTSPLPTHPSQSTSGITDVDNLISFDDPYMEQWKQASDIEHEVNGVNTNIDNLIHSLGLDPVEVARAEEDQVNGAEIDTSVLDSSLLPSSGIPITDATNDELFNSFMNNFPSPVNPTAESSLSTPFNFASANPPIQPDNPSSLPTSSTIASVDTPLGVSTRAQKRKSDSGTEVAMNLHLPSNPKAKRRKDK